MPRRLWSSSASARWRADLPISSYAPSETTHQPYAPHVAFGFRPSRAFCSEELVRLEGVA